MKQSKLTRETKFSAKFTFPVQLTTDAQSAESDYHIHIHT